jgi:hypothetical protein
VVPRSDDARAGSVIPPDPHSARAENWTAPLDPRRRDRGGRPALAGGRLWTRELGAQHPRARGEVTLSRDRHSETYKVEEVGAEDAIPVLREYIAEIRVTRAYFDATPNSSDEAVAAELSRHAVFRLIPSTLNRHEKE